MNKFYAVRVGRKPGVYDNWPAAQEQVDKYPGTVYQSFERLEDARDFVDGVVRSTIEVHDNGRVARYELTDAVRARLKAAGFDVGTGTLAPVDIGDGTTETLRKELLAAGLAARGGAASVLDAVTRAELDGRISSQQAAALRRTVRSIAQAADRA